MQKSLENSINSEEKRLNKGIDIWNDTIRQTDELKNNKIKHEEELQRARESMPDLTMLSTIRQWFTRKQGFDQHLAETTKEVEKYTRSAKENRERRNQLLSHPLFANLTIGTGSMEVEQYLTETTRHIKEQQHVLNEQEKHVLVREKLKAYADELEEGKPCPLCGAMHHPERFQSDDTGNELTGIRERGIDLEKQIARVSKLEKQLHLLENSHLDALRQIKEWEAKLLERQEQNREHERQFAWPEYKEEKVLDEAFRHAEQLQATIKQKEIELNKITSSWEKEEKNKERYREELDKIRKTLTQQLAELDILRGQLQLVKAGEYLDITPDAIKKEQKRLLAEYRHLEQTFSDTGKQLQEQQQQSERCKSIVTINQQELQQEQSALIDLQQQLDERLADSPFETFEEVAGILSTPFVLEQEKRRVAQFKEQITRNKTTIERLEEEIGSSMYDMEEHQQLVAEIDQVSKQVTENNREQGNLEGIIKKLASDLESQSRLHQELEKLAGRAENLRTMKSLFKASGFVEYISSVYLQNLCNAANDRFYRLTRQQLSLEITGDNNFQVRDYLNGGKVRSVKTLSGGQTFQASLSLALALADNIQKITRSHQNFFFLDEGFGSLDKESLDIVFDTLKSLRSENRVVGVISHVEEMQQEIDVHLRVENHPERGSLIHRGWQE